MKALLVALSVLALSSPAMAQQDRARTNFDHGGDSTPSDTARTGDVNAQGERVICRSVRTSSTSRVATRRVCRTAAEWRQDQLAD